MKKPNKHYSIGKLHAIISAAKILRSELVEPLEDLLLDLEVLLKIKPIPQKEEV